MDSIERKTTPVPPKQENVSDNVRGKTERKIESSGLTEQREKEATEIFKHVSTFFDEGKR